MGLRKIKAMLMSLLLGASIFMGGQTVLASDMDNDFIQQQLDAFDEVDAQIRANRPEMVLPDKTELGQVHTLPVMGLC